MGIDWKYGDVATDSSQLGPAIKARRLELGMSVSRAARLADVDRSTWAKWESGESDPYESNYVKIERALEWPARYVSALRDGEEPQGVQAAVPPVPADVRVDPALWAAMLPQHREQYVRITRVAHRRREQQRAASS